MLERLNTPGHEMISTPDVVVERLIRERLAVTQAPVYYEVGVGIGATTLAVARAMANRGEIILFSREHDVKELASDLSALGFANVNSEWGSPTRTYSGYHFELAYGFLKGALPTFDLAYLDGGHVFHLDAPAACVLKELCKPGGFLVFDDWTWSLDRSTALNPRKRPATAAEYDPRQIGECHVQMACRIVMDTDKRFEFLGIESDSAIYRRIA